jgi:hypothetical protein
VLFTRLYIITFVLEYLEGNSFRKVDRSYLFVSKNEDQWRELQLGRYLMYIQRKSINIDDYYKFRQREKNMYLMILVSDKSRENKQQLKLFPFHAFSICCCLFTMHSDAFYFLFSRLRQFFLLDQWFCKWHQTNWTPTNEKTYLSVFPEKKFKISHLIETSVNIISITTSYLILLKFKKKENKTNCNYHRH